MHGLNTLSFLSSNVAPCICPDNPIALTFLRLTLFASEAITFSVASSQSCGFCSDQPFFGRIKLKETDASAQTFWASSMTMPFK